MGSAASAQMTWLVDPKATGNNSGQPMWVDAFTDLPSALAIASNGDTILIAEDTYVPAPAVPPRTATFSVQDGQTLIGGYLGVDGGPNASVDPLTQDGTARGTILTGEIGSPLTSADNLYTVVTITANFGSFQVVRNLTIQDGYAGLQGSAGGESCGVGLFASQGSVEVADVIFKDNYAEEEGGALFFNGGLGRGIGLTRCVFWGNTCGHRGGAVFVETPTGPAHADHDEAWIFNCMFVDNTAGTTATNLNNGAAGGGAIWFSDLLDTDLWVSNNLVLANSCRGHGSGYGANGGIANCNLYITNDTFYGNHTTEIDTTLFNKGWVLDFPGTFHSLTTIANSIVWGNSWQANPSGPLDFSIIRSGSQTVTYCDVEMGPIPTTGILAPFPGVGNIVGDPNFANPAGLNVSLLPGSPCIDVGFTFVLPNDFGDADRNGVRSAEVLPVDWTSTQMRVIDSGPPGQGACGANTSFCGFVDMGARETN